MAGSIYRASTYRAPGADVEAAWAMWMRRQRYAAEIREYMDTTDCSFLDAEVAVLVAQRLSGGGGPMLEDFDV